jgi:L-aspartate oxidase
LFAEPDRPVTLGRADGPVPDVAEIRDLMWEKAGLVRTADDLRGAVDRLAISSSAVRQARAAAPSDRQLRRVASLVTVGLLIARAALRREESRGGHFRADFPRRDDLHWHKHVSDVLLSGSGLAVSASSPAAL